MSIGQYLEKYAQEQPEKIAIYFAERSITYREFYYNITMYQHKLRQYSNNNQPQKVALLIGNEPAFLEMFFATITLGWIAIPFNPKWSKRESMKVVEMANPDIVVTSEQFKKEASYTFKATFSVENIAVPKLSNINVHVQADTPFYLGFTSGSTGDPKGFIRNHRSWLASFTAGEEVFHYGKDDIIMAPGPLCHSLSLFGAVHALHIGATFYLTSSFSAKMIFNTIKAQQATVVFAVPTMLHNLAKLPESIQTNVTFLSSGAKLQPQIKQDLKQVFPNNNIYEYYGASELSYVTYIDETMSTHYPNSVGTPFPAVDISIRNNAGNVLTQGEIGHIYIKSNFLFTGYVNEEAATKSVLTKHGATIGDIGFINEAGLLTIVGRKNNMIISGAHNIYPEEIEKIMKDVPFVKEAVVIGVSDARWGQKVIALIQWKENGQHNLSLLKAHCRKNLAIYKRPRKYYIAETFPYTTTGKIARNEIEANISRWMI
ncbi:AMP-binding protein [Pseudogracilibacillus sp. SO30301A]|uniref:AMP-binding protein n=1 Tax=Pseudogracilibacillus sp. SO30301A TaxID=3098291 RepID=UPI00300DC8DD